MNPSDGRVVSNFIMQALRGEDITIFGDGLQTRSFQYVDDLVEGMIRMMASDPSFLGPVNLGNPNEFTMLELAQAVIRLTNSKSTIIHMPLPQDDPKTTSARYFFSKRKIKWMETYYRVRRGTWKNDRLF